MRLLMDEMLTGLTRWLRAAGHDAALARRSAADRTLIERAAAENRILVTKDRRLDARARQTVASVLIVADGVEAEAAALSKALRLDWTFAPFTRCVMDNTALVPAGPEHLARMPGDTAALPGPFNVCPACGRIYWPGSHVKRMRARLEDWRRAYPP